jgi:hypothetical protein
LCGECLGYLPQRLALAVELADQRDHFRRQEPWQPRARLWRDMTRPTLDEMYYDPMKARPTATRLQRGYDLIGLSAPTMLIQK